MPSPQKDRPSGRLGRLLAALRPSRAGPFPVQTGFPTSLADLVVKNHGRLKKQPSPSSNSKRGKRGGAANASPSPSPSPPTPTSPPPASPPPPVPAAVSPSADRRPRPDVPPAQQPRRGGGGGFGLGLGFLAVSGVVSLALLVIWSKKVVAAVTVASLSLYLLESVRPSSSSLPWRRSRPAVTETRRLCLVDGRGRVSPIREVDAETETEPSSRPSCSDSDRASEASCILAAEADESTGVPLDETGNPKAKAKEKNKSWKKLLAGAKKLHRGRRIDKEAGSSGSSFRSDGDRADDDANAKAAADPSGSRRGAASQTGAAAEDAKEASGSSRGSRRSQGVVVEPDASVDDLIEEEEGEGEEVEEEEQAGIIRFPALVLVAMVLAGLVAGKVLALVLTVLCSVFLCSVQRSPSGGGIGGWSQSSQGRRLEPSVS